MSDENELNESEMDQLLRELEQKSNSKPKESKQPKPAVPVKEARPNNVPKKKLPKEGPKKSEVAISPKHEKNAPQASGVSVVQRGSSESLERKISIFLFCLTTPLLTAAIWMLGNYLASFVSVGWLIAIVSIVGVFGLSYFFKRIIGKGRFMIWSGLVSLLLLVAMVLPATFAARKMIEFGHWPVSAITDASGMERDNAFVSFSNRISKSLANFRAGFSSGDPVVSFPKELGKDLPLIPEIEPEIGEEKKETGKEETGKEKTGKEKTGKEEIEKKTETTKN